MFVRFGSESGARSIRLIDPIVKRLTGFSPKTIEVERRYQKRRSELCRQYPTIVDGALYDLDITDNKAAALLTHISVIIAALVFSIGTIEDQGPVLVAFVVVEIILYTLSAMLLLRCLNFMGKPKMLPMMGSDEEVENSYLDELLVRKAIYVSVLRWVYVLTGALVVAIIIKGITPFL